MFANALRTVPDQKCAAKILVPLLLQVLRCGSNSAKQDDEEQTETSTDFALIIEGRNPEHIVYRYLDRQPPVHMRGWP